MNQNELEDILSKVTLTVFENTVMSKVSSSAESDSHYQGIVAVTSGLSDHLGYELLSYGSPDWGDMELSAKMLLCKQPNIFAIEIPSAVLLEIEDPTVPFQKELVYKQAVVVPDRTDGQAIQWMADGGLPFLGEDLFQEKIIEQLTVEVREDQEKMDAIRAQNREHIELFGYTKLGVIDPLGKDVPFVYTVGLTKRDAPELIVSGRFDVDFLSSIIDHFANRLLTDPTNFTGVRNAFETEQIDGKYLQPRFISHHVTLREVDPTIAINDFLIQAEAILNEPVRRVVQIEFSDTNGRHSNQPGYVNIFSQIEIPSLN